MARSTLCHRTVEPSSWDEAKEMMSALTGTWLFRGQSHSQWGLKHSLERVTGGEAAFETERKITSAFMRAAHHYLDPMVLPKTDLERLALMQHHGAPSRMHDWTRTPYVAAFIAYDAFLEVERERAIWAVDAPWCRKQALAAIRREIPELSEVPEDADLAEPELFDQIFLHERVSLVAPVEPFKLNQRMISQQGTFLVPGRVSVPLEENFAALGAEELCDHMMQIHLPSGWRAEALRDLDTVNINAATLFPGFDGFAQSLRNLPLVLSNDAVGDLLQEKRKRFGFV